MKKKFILLLIISFLFAINCSHAAEEKYLGNSGDNEGSGEITSEIFGKKGGYIHPFLPVAGLYTDNIFNTNTSKASDYATVLSPGIWFAVPGTRTQVVEIDSSSTTPGGLNYDITYARYSRRFQAYLLGATDFTIYSDYSEADTEEYKVEGFFQYNFPGELSIDLINQYLDSNDGWSTRKPGELDEFKNNLFTVRATYDFHDRFRIRADYANYNVNYDEPRNSSRDRIDNSFSGFFIYNFTPKYSIFAQYEYINVKYDTFSLDDNKSNRLYGGLHWEITEKSLGRFQIGYTNKEFENRPEDKNNFIFRARVRHRFTSKTALILRFYRQIREPYTIGIEDILTKEFYGQYSQRITNKITAYLELRYRDEDWNGRRPGEIQEREDKYLDVSPYLDYRLRKWLSTQFAYKYSERDSNFSILDYKTNIFLIRITASL